MEILVNRVMVAQDNYAVAYCNSLPKSAKDLDAHTGVYNAITHQLANLEDNKEPLTMAAQAALVAMSNMSPTSPVNSLVPSIYDQEMLDILPTLKDWSDTMASGGLYLPYFLMMSTEEAREILAKEDEHAFLTLLFAFEMNRKDNQMHYDFFVSTVDLTTLIQNSAVAKGKEEGTLVNFFPIIFSAPSKEIVSTSEEPGVSAGFLFMESNKKEDTTSEG